MARDNNMYALVCPPRSGSNFLQALLRRCTRMKQGAFYSAACSFSPGMLMKSHAMSYLHLVNEVGSFCPDMVALPCKVVVMWRHPVYATLSANAYNTYQGGEEVANIEEFLSIKCKFYECGLAGGTYGGNHREFFQNWNVEAANVLHVRYEELVRDADGVLGSVCDFFGLKDPARVPEGLLEELSRELQTRWQGARAQEHAGEGKYVPLEVRQYPSEFSEADLKEHVTDRVWSSFEQQCLSLGYEKPAWGGGR